MGPGRLCVCTCVRVRACECVWIVCGCLWVRSCACTFVCARADSTARGEGLGGHLVCVCVGARRFKLAIASPNWKETDAPHGGAGPLFGPALPGPARAGREIQVGELRF